MIRIAIDGACKGNGKADCVSSSGVVIVHDELWHTLKGSEANSTNQRGELQALLAALQYCRDYAEEDEDVQIITDSEYIFNTMTKEWYVGWERSGWVTSMNTPVKNQYLWEDIVVTYRAIKTQIMFYHLKGHLLPDGGQAAMTVLYTGTENLYKHYLEKFDVLRATGGLTTKLEHAQELSVHNNGFELTDDILRTFVALNMVADRVAVDTLLNY